MQGNAPFPGFRVCRSAIAYVCVGLKHVRGRGWTQSRIGPSITQHASASPIPPHRSLAPLVHEIPRRPNIVHAYDVLAKERAIVRWMPPAHSSAAPR